jgi:long-chain acyl-CoA synthetase
MPNCPELVVQWYAALRADMIAVAVSPELTSEELLKVVREVEPRCCFVHHELSGEFEKARVKARIRDPKVYYLRPGQDFIKTDYDEESLDRLLVEPTETMQRLDLDVASLQYTSGTTGGTKAAMMSHRNLVANALQNNLWFNWTHEDVILGALPLYHTWGMCCVMNAAFVAGASIALLEEFDSISSLELIRSRKVTIAYGSGTMFVRLLDAAGDDTSSAFASLRYVKAGAMLIDSSLNERWAATVPSVPMVNGYGLTEASPEVTNNPPHKVKSGTVGIPLPGTEIRLMNRDNPEQSIEADQEGEIQIRGPQVMLGYWSEPEATRNAFLQGGWLRTGDVGVLDSDGYLKIVDRVKDIIKFRGYSVSPGEVERLLHTHPAIAEACVVGMPDPTDGEVPVAFLVLEHGAPLDIADMPDFVEPHLASHKIPRRFHIVHEIPKNHVGKPLKRVLREMPEQ